MSKEGDKREQAMSLSIQRHRQPIANLPRRLSHRPGGAPDPQPCQGRHCMHLNTQTPVKLQLYRIEQPWHQNLSSSWGLQLMSSIGSHRGHSHRAQCIHGRTVQQLLHFHASVGNHESSSGTHSFRNAPNLVVLTSHIPQATGCARPMGMRMPQHTTLSSPFR